MAKLRLVSRMRFFGPINVTLLTQVIFIISTAAQRLMSINAAKKDLPINLNTKYVNIIFEIGD